MFSRTDESLQTPADVIPDGRRAFRSDIEGLRAVAVLAVVLFHAGLPGISGGFIGVDIFFAVSGYLITELLAREFSSHNNINFWAFYARRARRLLPAASLVAVITLGLGLCVYGPTEEVRYAKSAIATFLYAGNLRFMRFRTDYFAPEVSTDPFLHMWSLAVEEQFYLIWPAVVLIGLRWRQLSGVLSLVALMSFGLSLVLTSIQPQWAFYSMPARGWEFAIGGLAAVASMTNIERRAPRLQGTLGLIAIGIGVTLLSERVAFPGWAATIPVLGTAAVLRAGRTSSTVGIGWLLTSPPAQYVGRLSYGIYLWHWPLIVIATAAMPTLSLTGRLAVALAAILLADLMYRALENPIRIHPWLLPRPTITLLGAGALTSVGILIAGTTALSLRQLAQAEQSELIELTGPFTRADSDRCNPSFSDNRVLECTFGDPSSSISLVLFGDSHASQWFPALEAIADQRRWRLVTLVKSSCTIADVPIISRSLRRGFHECEEWREDALQRILAIRPMVVVASNVTGTYIQWLSKSRTRERNIATVAAGMRRTLASLDAAGISTILMRDTPLMGFDVPSCLARARYHQRGTDRCTRSFIDAVSAAGDRAEELAAAGLSHVTWADLTGYICPEGTCLGVIQGVPVFRDSQHLSVAFATRLRDPLNDVIASRLPAFPTAAVANARSHQLTSPEHYGYIRPVIRTGTTAP